MSYKRLKFLKSKKIWTVEVQTLLLVGISSKSAIPLLSEQNTYVYGSVADRRLTLASLVYEVGIYAITIQISVKVIYYFVLYTRDFNIVLKRLSEKNI